MVKIHKILERNEVKHGQMPCKSNEVEHHTEQVYREYELLWSDYDAKIV